MCTEPKNRIFYPEMHYVILLKGFLLKKSTCYFYFMADNLIAFTVFLQMNDLLPLLFQDGDFC